MEQIEQTIPLAALASAVAVSFAYLFLMPILPGVRFSKRPWLLALFTTLIQTVSTPVIAFVICAPAMYMSFWAALGGQSTAIPVLMGSAITMAALLAWLFNGFLLGLGTSLAKGLIVFTGGYSKPLAAGMLLLVQVLAYLPCIFTTVAYTPYNRFGYIDRTGKFAIPAQYESGYDFINGISQVQLPATKTPHDGKLIYIDHSGKPVTDSSAIAQYQRPTPKMTMDDLPEIYEDNGEYSAGRFVIEQHEMSFLPFSENLAASRYSDALAWGFVDRNFKVVIPRTFDDVRSFSDGLAAVAIKLDDNGQPTTNSNYQRVWGYIDRNGNWVVPPKFKSAERFVDGLACVTIRAPTKWEPEHSLCGYIDKKGNFVIPPTFEYGNTFSEGLAGVIIKATGR